MPDIMAQLVTDEQVEWLRKALRDRVSKLSFHKVKRMLLALDSNPEYRDQLLAEAVASQEQTPSALRPDGDSEHATQRDQTFNAPFFVQMCDDFSVRRSTKGVSARNQFRSEINVVVNLPVKNNLHLAIFIGDRLVTTRNINDAEAPNCQPDAVAHKESTLVGAAMPNSIRHVLQSAPYFGT